MKIALIQESFKGEKQLEKTAYAIKKAASSAELVCLQELHTNHYFCQAQDLRNFEYAHSFDTQVAFFSDLAKSLKIVLVTSLFEQRAPGLYHNTAVVFEKDGKIAGTYKKMHIPDDNNFYEKYYFTPGEQEKDSGFRPINTSVGRLGILVCWDQWYPEAARIMALNGAEILIYPTAIGSLFSEDEDERARQIDAWVSMQRSHAIANGIYVVSINRVGKEGESLSVIFNPSKEALEKSKSDKEGIDFFGNSFIASPQGEILGRLDSKQEGILEARLDMGEIERIRNIWPFLRDRRIDAYSDLLKRFAFRG
ncbi:carbon-nitrogen hydrolase [Helicobacter sp. 13S00401-1]|uniref:carbon-nitrogen hydrolase n=1 Tax=Helicobacter sp. 13S00401-1 TaxID=1905758 RepID=UPI00117A3620|nr:carbon-nitrogen hydrolase [Helicobacter sp. 13S00401-1]